MSRLAAAMADRTPRRKRQSRQGPGTNCTEFQRKPPLHLEVEIITNLKHKVKLPVAKIALPAGRNKKVSTRRSPASVRLPSVATCSVPLQGPAVNVQFP